jgi:N-acetylneuraminic acid mutarotase
MKIKIAVQVGLMAALTLLAPRLAQAVVEWTPTTSFPSARYCHTATLLANGKVLVVGGMGESFNYLDDCRLFDLSTNTWNPAAHLNHARSSHTATRLTDGSVLVVGGVGPSGPVYEAERYDPVNNQWTAAGTYSTPRWGHSATLLGNGKVLVVGGETFDSSGMTFYGNCDLYNPAGDSWTAAGSLTTARAYHTATLLPDGDVLVVGGDTGSEWTANPLASTERYNLSTGWSQDADLHEARTDHSATLLRNGQLLVAGGNTGADYTSIGSAELYYNGSWHTTGSMQKARFQHTATLLSNGMVLMTGGASHPGGIIPECELYTPGTMAWTATGSLKYLRTLHTVTRLTNGKVLAAGGTSAWGEPPIPYCELYNSQLNSISPLGLLLLD